MMAGFRDYEMGKLILIESSLNSDDFYGVIQCAMRLADTDNLEKLKSVFPKEWTDLQTRYDAPGGLLEGERRDE
jgi:hypothetical protein